MKPNFQIIPSRLQATLPLIGQGSILKQSVGRAAIFGSGYTDNPKLSREENLHLYIQHQMENEAVPMEPQGGYHMVKFLTTLDAYIPTEFEKQMGRNSLVETHLSSHDDPFSALRFLNSLKHFGISHQSFDFGSPNPLKAAATTGSNILWTGSDYSFEEMDEAQIVPAKFHQMSVAEDLSSPVDQFVFSFDWDAAVASAASERIYQNHGLDAFTSHELNNLDVPMERGGLFALFRSLMIFRQLFGKRKDESPLLIGITTARGSDVAARVFHTTREWMKDLPNGFHLDFVKSRCGAPKGKTIRTLVDSQAELINGRVEGVHLDDHDDHVADAVKYGISGAVVPNDVRKNKTS